MSRYFMLGQINSGYITLCQVRSCYVMLDKFILYKIRLGQVNSGYLMLVQIRAG
jgi:hypothetical protein